MTKKYVAATVGRCPLCKTGVSIEYETGGPVYSASCTNKDCRLHASLGFEKALETVVEELEAGRWDQSS